MPTIGENIRAVMNQKRISVRKLATMAGMQPTTVQRIVSGERPNPKIDSVKKIAAALGVGVNRLTY